MEKWRVHNLFWLVLFVSGVMVSDFGPFKTWKKGWDPVTGYIKWLKIFTKMEKRFLLQNILLENIY